MNTPATFTPPRRARRTRPRQWLPAPARRANELTIPREVDGQLGLFLMLAVRRVRDWVELPEAGREGCFGPNPEAEPERHARFTSWLDERLALAQAEAPELSEPLTCLASLALAPEAACPSELARACDAVSAWAESRGLEETAVQFSEAAAALEPGSAQRANLAGRACRLAGLWSRADVWYLRGIGIARREKNRREYFRGQLGAGRVAYLQGRYIDAKRHFLSGAWKARDIGNVSLGARAQHDLMLLAVETGDLAGALAHAQRALDWYPPRHPRLPHLTHDYAYLLVTLRQDEPAQRMLEQVLPHVVAEHERLMVMGSLARSTAGLGDHEGFTALRARVIESASKNPQYAAPAVLEVAKGAWVMEAWPEAEATAALAHGIATEQGRADVVAAAAAVLRDVAQRNPAPSLSATAALLEQSERLAFAFLQRLEQWDTRRESHHPA